MLLLKPNIQLVVPINTIQHMLGNRPLFFFGENRPHVLLSEGMNNYFFL
jgi:hypothetical protein